MKRVLSCVRAAAPEAALVERALVGRGAVVESIDPSGFPLAPPLGAPGAYDAIWAQLVVGTRLPALPDRATCIAAAEMMLAAWIDASGAFVVDPRWVQLRADNKPAQLAAARAAGLDVPPTLVTNDAAAVRGFARAHGAIVAKLLVQPDDGTMFTTVLEEVDDLDGLELCPMIFQARVPNERDVRAIVVGRRVIAASLAAGHDVDWRREAYAEDRALAWAPYELPGDVAAALVRLADRLGLQYGAADLVRRPDGSHAFLELNATGAFAFLGDAVAASVADALAAVLLDPEARRG